MLGENNYGNYQVSKKLVKEKITAHDLKLGMYVVELDRPWSETPFLFQGFLINHVDEIEQLCKFCDFVYIDVTQTNVQYKEKHKTVPRTKASRINKVSAEKELPVAITYYDNAKNAVDNILSSLRLSHDLDMSQIKSAVKDCVKSVLKNPNALMWLTQIRNKDDYTAEHCLRVSMLSIALGQELNLSEEELENVGIAGMLHDVGKIKIPDEVLNKEGALSSEEYKLIQTHATEGHELLVTKTNVPSIAVDVAYSHHERMDGKGYPRGLSGEEIPYLARIVCIIDAFDAMTSERVYCSARSTLVALRILYDCRGTQFDEEMVSAFIRLVGVYPPGHIVELSNGEAGIILSCPENNKLRPKVFIVRNKEKKLCPERIIDLGRDLQDQQGQPLRVKEIFVDGEFGINLQDYREKGLKFDIAV